jgi:hypothetical protein
MENAKRQLKLGEYLSIDLPSNNKERPIVPKQAVYPNETGEPHVYKVTGNDAVRPSQAGAGG